MKKYVIQGGAKLHGDVVVSGSKNAALPILAATLLTDDDVILRNVPRLKDVTTMLALLAKLGKKVILEDERLIVQEDVGSRSVRHEATYDIVKQMRASIVVLGPLVARYRQAIVSLPGGCAFGPRPIDLHLKGLAALGVKIEMKHGDIHASARNLKGASIDLMGEFGSSVLGTDNVAMAAVLASGETVIENAAREPETIDLMEMLGKMGAKIEGAGTSTLRIHGVKKLHGCDWTVIPDRIEAGTFIAAAAVTGGRIRLKACRTDHLEAVLDVCREIGIGISEKAGVVTVTGKKPSAYKGFNLTTMPYPKFPTDLQSLFTVVGALSKGISSLREGIYPNRWSHVPELARMGAQIQVENETAILGECKGLDGASVQASDLRAGAALVVAGLAARGTTEVRRIYHVDRGYEELPEKLRALGAHITVESDTLV
ncbi:MAG: UDP-N-acetylglucosamine 1-carboxyvinyltransferase [Spirochaetes bacterium]|nr:UDP-N-acetylglucosamine 1-carboxyvinyltransferase [Spirochaetota bacterium]